jgi:hypothetical protein
VHRFLDVCGFIPQLKIQSPIGWPFSTVTAGSGASFSGATPGEAAAGDETHGIGKSKDHDPCSAVEKNTTAAPEEMIKTTKIRLKKKRTNTHPSPPAGTEITAPPHRIFSVLLERRDRQAGHPHLAISSLV